MNKLIKTAIRLILIVVACAVVFFYGVNTYMVDLTSVNVYSAENVPGSDEYDCILILGCGVKKDGTPSDMLADRLDEGINLYEKGVAGKLLMSGDHGRKDYDEVNVMKKYAESKGVPLEDIFMDHAGFSTYESIYRAKAIFEAENIVVVTQKYHIYRALYIANSFGINAVGVNADPRSYRGHQYNELREMAARAKDFVICRIKPEPTYLGDVIPVGGDGNRTND